MPENNEGINILEIGFDLKRTILKATRNLPKHYVVLIVVKSKNYSNLIGSFLDLFINDYKLNGIYLTTNKTADKLEATIRKQSDEIDTKNLNYIDCMGSKINPEFKGRTVTCAPQDLTSLNLMIEQSFRNNPNTKFLVVDSLSTFFIYNEAKVIEKFVRSIIKKVNDRKIIGVFITTRTKSNEGAIDEISVFFDDVIQISS